jgi:multidrug efflux pump subunit AcrA (membrane-fusion protein)
MEERTEPSRDEEELRLRRRFRIMLGLLAATALTLVLLIGLMGLWWTSISGRLETAHRTPDAPPPVAVLPARAERWSRSMVLRATLQPRVAERVPAPVAGRVARVMVRPGERVKAGQVVARIAATEGLAGAPARPGPAPRGSVTAQDRGRAQAKQRLAQAQQASHAANLVLATARAARAQAAARRDALDRQTEDTERRFARTAARSKQDMVASRPAERFDIAGSDWRPGYDSDRPFPGVVQRHPDRLSVEAHTVRAAATAARIAVAHSDDAVRAARRECERAEAAIRTALHEQAVSARPRITGARRAAPATLVDVRSASEGVVAGVTAAPGVRIASGQTVLRLARSSAAQYRVEGEADDLRGVHAGLPARIQVGGTTVPARVRAVSPQEGGRCRVDLVAERAPAPGAGSAGVRAELTVPAVAPVICVPVPAVLRTADGTALWIAQPDSTAPVTWTAHRRLVRLGMTRDGKVEICAGLEAGERVIVAGMEPLRDGQPVAAVPWNLP